MGISKQDQNFLKQSLKKLRFFLLESDDPIINWSNYYKGIMLGVFGLSTAVVQLIWYYFNFHSENKIWLNESFYSYRVTTLSCTGLTFLILLIVAFKFRNSAKVQTFIGYFMPFFFGFTMLYGGYTIGMYSPAMMAGTVNIILVGLVLYNRKLIYLISAPIAIMMVWLAYQTYFDKLPYAPLFSDLLNDSHFYQNKFWIRTMVELFLPVLIITAILFEILLSQWRRREKNIKTMSQTDALTQVYNRRYISDQLDHLAQESNYAVVLLDLDYFKKINDQYGHDIGDIVLKRVANLLKVGVREQDIVGRFGGEEFILILKNTTLPQAVEIAERCRISIENEIVELNDAQTLHISASFGISLAKPDASKEQITRWADEALYQAKHQGRNCICISDDKTDAK